MRVLIAWLVAMVSVSVSHAQNETNREILSEVILLCDLSGTSKTTVRISLATKETKFPRASVTVKIQKVRNHDLVTYQANIGGGGSPFRAFLSSLESPNSETEYSFQEGNMFEHAMPYKKLVINRFTGTLDYHYEDFGRKESFHEQNYFGTCEKQTKQKF